MVNDRLKYFDNRSRRAKPPSLKEHARKPNGASRLRIGSCPRAGAGRACQHPALRTSVRSRRVAAVAPAPYLRGMNGTKNDVDPASELLEEDEEQALPEPEADLDLSAAVPRRIELAAALAALAMIAAPRDHTVEGEILAHPALVASALALDSEIPADKIAIVPERHIAFMVAW